MFIIAVTLVLFAVGEVAGYLADFLLKRIR